MSEVPVTFNVKDCLKEIKKLPKHSYIVLDEAKKYTKKEWRNILKQLKGGNK